MAKLEQSGLHSRAKLPGARDSGTPSLSLLAAGCGSARLSACDLQQKYCLPCQGLFVFCP